MTAPRFPDPLRALVAALLVGTLAPAPAHAADVHVGVKAGVDAWEKGDFKGAVGKWRPLALRGDADAQFNLGQAYKLGRGVTADLVQAEDWFRRAAGQGHLQAEDNLGLVMFTVGKREAAMPHIIKSAGRGEPRAQYLLGTAHFNGDLAPRDPVRAYALIKRSSDAGLVMASSRLVELDTLISLEDRQAGIALAQKMEHDEAQARIAALGPVSAAPAASPASAAPVVTAAPASAPRPAKPMVAATPKPVRAPVAAAPAPTLPASRPAASAPWRAQMGAFGQEAGARTAWSRLSASIPAARSVQPIYDAGPGVVRLQAGFATRADADAFCRTVSAKGQACFVAQKR